MKRALISLISCLMIFIAATTFHPQPVSAGSTTPTAYDIVWSPDGQWMAVSSSQGAWFFDLDNPDSDPLHLFPDRRVSVIAFDPI
jgi:hypothetical protein